MPSKVINACESPPTRGALKQPLTRRLQIFLLLLLLLQLRLLR